MSIYPDARQIRVRDLLSQLATAVNTEVDNLFISVDKELTPSLVMRPASTPDRTFTIGPLVQTNGETSRRHTIAPIGGTTLPANTLTTITLPVLSNGAAISISGDYTLEGSPTLTVSASNYIKMGVNVSASGQVKLVFGTEGASESAATLPASQAGYANLGYIVIQVNGSQNVQNITNSSLVYYAVSSSGASFAGFADGTVGAPGAFWVSDTDTGFYRKSSGSIGFVSNGSEVGSWSILGQYVFGPTTGASGTLDHSFRSSSGNTYISIDPVSATGLAGLSLDSNSTSKWLIVNNAGSAHEYEVRNAGNTVVAYSTQAGAWTFGPGSGLTVSHLFRNNASSDYALTVYNQDTTSTAAGLKVRAGTTNAAQSVLSVANAANSVNYYLIRGDGASIWNNSSGVETGSVNAAGVWVLGPSSGLTSSHIIRSGAATNTPTLDIISTVTGANPSIRFNPNAVADYGEFLNGGTAGYRWKNSSNTILGELSHNGSWTFGGSSISATTHRATTNGATEWQVHTTGTNNNVYLRFMPNGTGKARIYNSTGTDVVFANSTDTQIGAYTDAGAWTLGTTSYPSHTINGNTTITGSNLVQLTLNKTTGPAALLFKNNGTDVALLNAKSTGGMEFYQGTPTLVGSYDLNGAWILGVSNTNQTQTVYGKALIRGYVSGGSVIHTFQNRDAANTAGGSTYVKIESFTSNAALILAPASTEQWYILSDAVSAPANGLVFSQTTNGQCGFVTTAGAWTFGRNAGAALTHTFRSNGQTIIEMTPTDGVSTTRSIFTLYNGAGTALGSIQTGSNGTDFQINATNTLIFREAGGNTNGSVTNTGTWTLGRTATVAAHVIQGQPTGDYVLKITNANSTNGQSSGVRVNAGAGTSDSSLVVANYNNTTNFLVINGGGVAIIGLSAGYGTTLGNTIYGPTYSALSTSTPWASYSGQDRLSFGVNIYRDSAAGAKRSIVNAAGYSYIQLDRSGTSTDIAFSFVANTDTQTNGASGTSITTNEKTVGSATFGGAWTIGPTGFTGEHTVYGDIEFGTTSTNVGKIRFEAASGDRIFINQTITAAYNWASGVDSSNNYVIGAPASSTSWTSKWFTIDTSGSVTLGTSGNSHLHVIQSSRASDDMAYIQNLSTTSPSVLRLRTPNTAADNNSSTFLWCVDSSTARMGVYSDGDVVNHDNSYGSISDVRLKQDIVDANSQIDDFMAIRFRRYRFISDVEANPNAGYHLGVVAQELAQTSPGLVNYDSINDTYSVQYSILQLKAAKALQEAIQLIRDQADEIASLKSRVSVLENN